MEKKGFNQIVSCCHFQEPEFKKFMKERLANYIGNEIINYCKNIDFDSFNGEEYLNTEINICSRECGNYTGHDDEVEISAWIKLMQPITFERTFISRKEEVTVDSKWYCGSKLTWKERWEALLKGRLYGGTEKVRRIDVYNGGGKNEINS